MLAGMKGWRPSASRARNRFGLFVKRASSCQTSDRSACPCSRSWAPSPDLMLDLIRRWPPTSCQRKGAYAAGSRPRVASGLINASAGIPHSRFSLHAIRMVSGRFPFRTSEARWRDPNRRPRSACV